MTHRHITRQASQTRTPVSLCLNCIHVDRDDCHSAGARYERAEVRTARGTLQVTAACTQHKRRPTPQPVVLETSHG